MINGYLGRDKPASHQQNLINPEQLTEREIEILQLVAEGYTNKEVAEKLVISVKTVETHKAHIAEKLGGKSRVEWMRYVRQKGWLKT
jgi:two-component system response regulator NreC